MYFTIWKYDGIYGKIKKFYEEKCRKRQKARGKMIFRCKNCGGNVVYSPERKKMFCPFCESEDSEEREDGVIETSGEENGTAEGTVQAAGAGQPVSRMVAAEGAAQKKVTKVCPNCGGEIPMTVNTSATQCPYCDNYVIVDDQISGAYTPHMLIPFRMGKEVCKKLIRDKFEKCIFAPTDFLSEVRMNGIYGDYVPFWFYDYNTNCTFHGEGTKVRSWTTGNTQYTETSYYDIVRDMDIDFVKIPVDASVGMPDDVMDLMEPFDYKELQEFKPEYLSGFHSERYNMTSDLVESRAKAKMQEDAQKMLHDSYSGYSSVRKMGENINVTDSSVSYGLLPVWKYDYSYKGKEYPFYVNGQTGKLVGTAPISKAKVWAYAGTLGVTLAAILCMVNAIASLV